jgi:hypothetical protein
MVRRARGRSGRLSKAATNARTARAGPRRQDTTGMEAVNPSRRRPAVVWGRDEGGRRRSRHTRRRSGGHSRVPAQLGLFAP